MRTSTSVLRTNRGSTKHESISVEKLAHSSTETMRTAPSGSAYGLGRLDQESEVQDRRSTLNDHRTDHVVISKKARQYPQRLSHSLDVDTSSHLSATSQLLDALSLLTLNTLFCTQSHFQHV